MKKQFVRASRVACGTALALSIASTGAFAASADHEMMLELKKLIEQQQQQLAEQAKEIAALKKTVGSVNVAMEQKVDKEEMKAMDGMNTSPFLKSKMDNVDLTFYGQVNKAVVFADNGSSSKTYFVDNDNSSSRLGVNAKVGVNEDFSVGGKVEYEFQSNASNVVNELRDTSTATFNLRHADIFFKSKKYGKVSLGQGSMSADGSSEVDLSGTTLVTYASVEDMAGGQLWYDGNVLDGTTVANVFSDFDAGRKDRIRYDSPSFYGFTLATSAATDDHYDLTLRYSREYDMAKVAAAVAYQSLGDSSGVDDVINGSFSVLLNSGFNLTLAGGQQSLDRAGDDDALFYSGKLGYQAHIFDFGKTAFSIDYVANDDVDVDGGDADSWGVGIVQNVPTWGTDFYLGFRQYMYETDSTDYDDINVVMSGARLKF